jgi:3',5'-nucleoside bisphosphate phosphatase
MTADLHSHTHYSDGTMSPKDLVELASVRGVQVLSVTDHDTMEGIPEALEAGRSYGVRIIPGVEITAHFHDQEMHILAYFADDGRWREGEFQKLLRLSKNVRFERCKKMVVRLRELGMKIDFDDVLKLGSRGSLGRPHVARALLAAGQIRSFDEAFSRFLSRGKPAWVDKVRVASEEAIRLIHGARGLAILAHPGLLKGERIPAELLDQGLDGIEAYHTKHDSRLSGRYLQWAEENKILCTGGSDCHGNSVHEPILGNVRIEGTLLENFLGSLSQK